GGGAAAIFASGGAGAGSLARVAVVRSVVGRQGHLGTIATDLLAGHNDVRDAVGREAVAVNLIGLRALRDLPYARVEADGPGTDEARGQAEANRNHDPDHQSKRTAPRCQRPSPPSAPDLSIRDPVKDGPNADCEISTRLIESIGEMNWTNGRSLDSVDAAFV